jgi:HK97 family phage major capsid protein
MGMSLEALRKSLSEKTAGLAALKANVAADTATDADLTALTTATAEVKALSERIDSLVEADAVAAKAAQPVRTPTAPAQAKQHPQDDKAEFTLGVLMAGMAATKAGEASSVREALEKNGFTAIADRFENLSGKQLSSSINSGGVLVPPTMATEIIEFLRPSTAFLQNNPRRVPLENGSFFQSGGATGASASYGRENSVPAYSEATFRDVQLFAKELQGKTAISNRLLQRGVAAIRSFVDIDLRSALSERMDLNLFVGSGLQASPLGIYNIPGIGARNAASTLTPTIAQVDADLNWAMNFLGTRNVNVASAKWTMRFETATFLRSMRDGNGNLFFPEMNNSAPLLKGLPVAITTNLPNNLFDGSNSDNSHLSLVAYDHVIFGEEDGITVRVSTEGSYTDGAGNIRSAVERNETVMFAEARHDVGVRQTAAIALLNLVRWGR